MATVTFENATRIYPGNDRPSVDALNLEIADGVVTRWNRLAIREVVHADDLADSYPGVGLIDNTDSDDDDFGFADHGNADSYADHDDSITLEKSRGDQDKS